VALDTASEALQTMGDAQAAIGWLERFDVGLATVGQYPQFAGGRIEIANEGEVPTAEPFDAARAIKLARKALDPPGPQIRRTHRVAAVSSR
jgi:hypothetical protein